MHTDPMRRGGQAREHGGRGGPGPRGGGVGLLEGHTPRGQGGQMGRGGALVSIGLGAIPTLGVHDHKHKVGALGRGQGSRPLLLPLQSQAAKGRGRLGQGGGRARRKTRREPYPIARHQGHLARPQTHPGVVAGLVRHLFLCIGRAHRDLSRGHRLPIDFDRKGDLQGRSTFG